MSEMMEVIERDEGAAPGDLEPLEGDEQDIEPEDTAGDEPDEPEPEPELEPEQGHTEQWWDDAWKKTENENARHAKRIGEIFEDEATEFAQCPMCLTGPAGFLLGNHFADEHKALILDALGAAPPADYKVSDFARECDKCGGLGQVITGSKVPGCDLTNCEQCSALGWVRVYGPNETQPASVATWTPPALVGVDVTEPPAFDAWSRPAGHPHFNIPPADVPV